MDIYYVCMSIYVYKHRHMFLDIYHVYFNYCHLCFRKISHTNQDELQVSQNIAANKVSLSAKFIVFWILPDDEINITVQRCKGGNKLLHCSRGCPSVKNVYAN